MSCYGQYYKYEYVDADNCCKAHKADLTVDVREINASLIRGTVTCEKGRSTEVSGALVVARKRSGSDKVFYAIADEDGKYAMLVDPGDYEVAAFSKCDWYDNDSEPCTKCTNC